MFALNEQEYQWLKDFSKTMQTHSTETLQLFFLYQDDYASLISLKTAIDDVKYKSLWMADLLNLYLKSDCESEKISLTGKSLRQPCHRTSGPGYGPQC
jgi:hypothetical protein